MDAMAEPIQPPVPDFHDSTLGALAATAAAHQPPPVEAWNPARCGDSDMRIAADGRWYHQGTPIDRPAMVRLFGTILRREEDGGYVLVTPAERLDIAVDDLPFRAIALRTEGTGRDRRLVFLTDGGDVVTAGPDHPVTVSGTADAPRPRLRVRGGPGRALEARLTRAVWQELVELALADIEAGSDAGETPPDDAVIWSDGARFSLASTGEGA